MMLGFAEMQHENVIMVWRCPSCEGQLNEHETGMRCSLNHSFDRAKEGYVNLLPAQHKRSRNPGDSAEMILGRRKVHEALLYQPLAQRLVDTLAARGGVNTLLDMGCGEGFYGGVVTQRLPHVSVYGIDVSKPAVKFAAKRYGHHHYAVASSRRLPIISSTIDCVLSVFSPCSDAEVARVLRPRGVYLEVGPGAKHLWEIKSALYDAPLEHKAMRRAMSGGTLLDSGEVGYEKTLDNTQLQALLAATPFGFRGLRERRAELQTRTEFPITMAFSWRLFAVVE